MCARVHRIRIINYLCRVLVCVVQPPGAAVVPLAFHLSLSVLCRYVVPCLFLKFVVLGLGLGLGLVG